MSKNYVITNCPVAFNTRVDGTYCNDVEITNGKNIHCQYITDCVLKQIVEKCKNTQFLSTKNRLDLYAVKVFANDLLQLLDMQEVKQDER